MGKPSIFSREYERKMKRRKVRNVVLVIFGVFAVVAIIFRGYLGNTFNNIKSISIKNIVKKESASKDKEEIKPNIETNTKAESKTESKAEETKETKKEESLEIQIENGAKVTAIYEVKNGEKYFSSINPGDNKMSYSISLSSKKIIIFDEKNQNIYLVNDNGEVKDISMKKYTTSSGDYTITKDAQLSANSTYIWHSLPKFIDETHVAYVSQLPWLNKDDKYIWSIDLNTMNYSLNYNVQGKNILLGNETDKGLEVKLDDGETKCIQSNGNIQ